MPLLKISIVTSLPRKNKRTNDGQYVIPHWGVLLQVLLEGLLTCENLYSGSMTIFRCLMPRFVDVWRLSDIACNSHWHGNIDLLRKNNRF